MMRFLVPLHDWFNSDNQTRLRHGRDYGIPPRLLFPVNAYVDLPEGEEGPPGKVLRGFALGFFGESLIRTTGNLSETGPGCTRRSFAHSHSTSRAEADLHFRRGINQLIVHGWPYTPPGGRISRMAFLRGGV